MVAEFDFAGDDAQANSFYARGRAGEVFIDDLVVKSDAFKDLCASVAGNGGDAHFRHGFNHAFDGSFEVFFHGIIVCHVEFAILSHLGEGINREVGVNYITAVS